MSAPAPTLKGIVSGRRGKVTMAIGGTLAFVGAVILLVGAVVAIAAQVSDAWTVVVAVGGALLLLGAAIGSFAAAGVVLRVMATVRSLARASRRSAPQGISATAPSDQGSPALVLAVGSDFDAGALIHFAQARPRGEVLVVTDRAEVVPAIARTSEVEFLPLPPAGVGTAPATAVSFMAARLVELVAERRVSSILVWSDDGVAAELAAGEFPWTSGGRDVPHAGTLPGAASPAIGKSLADEVKKSSAETRKHVDRALKRHQRQLSKSMDAIYRQGEALTSLYRLLEPDSDLPPMRGWAVSPDLALHVVRGILDGRVRSVVETGSGTSTVIFALALARAGGDGVVALEHDADYAHRTMLLAARYGVADRVDVRHAPLVDLEVGGDAYRWYDIGGVAPLRDVDLLFVDGPPAATGRLARYPAVPLLRPWLAPSALVVLDDAGRSDEAEIVDLWSQLPGVTAVTTLDVERAAVELTIVADH